MHTKLPVPNWFTNAMADGISQLLPLSLRGGPPFDAADLVADAWAKALWPQQAWSITTDEIRIAEGFRQLAATCEFFPAPKKLIENLPSRAPAQDWKSRPEEPAEVRAAVRAKFQELSARLDYADQLEREKAAVEIEERQRSVAAMAAATAPRHPSDHEQKQSGEGG